MVKRGALSIAYATRAGSWRERTLAAFVAAVLLDACSGGTATNPFVSRSTVANATSQSWRTDTPIFKLFHGRDLGPHHFNVLYDFGPLPDGNGPLGGLIDVNGTLYGTTFLGGAYAREHTHGTVFSITLGGKEKVLHSFGEIYTDGYAPVAPLVDVKGALYGTTESGGAYYQSSGASGTVFIIKTSGKEKVLHSFRGGTDGANPVAGLIDVKGTLYGTTYWGGVYGGGSGGGYGGGTVFTITPSGAENVLHSFGSSADGSQPWAALIDVDGTLYGTTQYGGTYNGGTVFSITPRGKEKVLHSFRGGADGAYPVAGLADVNGMLYGTTEYGGTYDDGTVFSIKLSGAEKTLHSFNGTDGADPTASLICVKGRLYGTTAVGGASNDGTVFSVTISGNEKVLHSFTGGTNGYAPDAPLIDVNGTLYGTTYTGDSRGDGGGNVFALIP